METVAKLPATTGVHSLPEFPPIGYVTSATVPTCQAAYYLNRRPQTMRWWASAQPAGVPRPIRINGRLAWKVADIRKLLEGGAV